MAGQSARLFVSIAILAATSAPVGAESQRLVDAREAMPAPHSSVRNR
jgi:hypothetical protein